MKNCISFGLVLLYKVNTRDETLYKQQKFLQFPGKYVEGVGLRRELEDLVVLWVTGAVLEGG